jgi:hypothetical protein
MPTAIPLPAPPRHTLAPEAAPLRPARLPLLLWPLLFACLYAPSLATRFDFIDDGDLVYPAPPLPRDQRLLFIWKKVVDNFEQLGPFRPVLWVHWETAAELFAGNPVAWRLARLLWAGLAAASFLWLLRELGIRRGAALFTVALAMSNPYRSEIWTSLTLSEGVAMPYALAALACAVRATRSRQSWRWDLAGLLAVLAALGCKNTFAALVPAMILLRVFPDGLSLREGWRHGRRGLLFLLALLPVLAHYAIFKLGWRPGQYTTGTASWAQLWRMLFVVLGAVGITFMGPGLAVAGLVVWMGKWATRSASRCPDSRSGSATFHRAACLAGVALLVPGVGIYLPLDAVSARYSMPAVWGADLLVAVLLHALWRPAPARRLRLAAGVLLGCGLAAGLVANLGRQDKFAARAALLWQVLEHVEAQAPPDTCIAWLGGPQLNVEEGIHFCWHLHNRGRDDLNVVLLDDRGTPLTRRELSPADGLPLFLVSGTQSAPPGGPWRKERDFRACYWCGSRRYDCTLYWRYTTPQETTPVGPRAEINDGGR